MAIFFVTFVIHMSSFAGNRQSERGRRQVSKRENEVEVYKVHWIQQSLDSLLPANFLLWLAEVDETKATYTYLPTYLP